MMRVMESTEGGMNAASSRSRKMLGSENATSVKRMKIRSIAPPRYAAMVPIAGPTASCISPPRGSRISSEADTRVHDGVEEIRREIPQDHEDPGEDQDAHEHRIVPIAQRVDEEPPHPRPAEDRLRHQRAPEQHGELH